MTRDRDSRTSITQVQLHICSLPTQSRACTRPTRYYSRVLTKLLVLVGAQRLEARPVQGLARLPQGLPQRVQPFPDHARHAAACRGVAALCECGVVVVYGEWGMSFEWLNLGFDDAADDACYWSVL